MLKENIDEMQDRLPKICKDCVIFADIINRLGGKNDIITGINRKPRNLIQIK